MDIFQNKDILKYLLNKIKICGFKVATCGIRPFGWIETINSGIEFGNWVRNNECNVILPDRYDLYKYIINNVLKNQPIDYLEFGVWKGDSLKYISTLDQNPRSRFFGFDSFEGLPDDWNWGIGKHNKGTFNVSGKIPNIQDDRVHFIKGLFQQTLPIFLNIFDAKNQLIINCDADLYASTLYILTCLNNKIIAPGAIIIFDEFFSYLHEYRAFRDYMNSYMRNYELVAATTRAPGDPILYFQLAIKIIK